MIVRGTRTVQRKNSATMKARFGEYEEGVLTLRPPQAWWDTKSRAHSTVLTVDSANREGSLLEIVHLLDDLDLVINKATISSDGCWLLDVFHIVDHLGRKVEDERVLQYINAVLTKDRKKMEAMGDLLTSKGRPLKRMNELGLLQAILLVGNDRPGLMSECAAVLTDHKYTVVASPLWTHAGRIASVIYVKDLETFSGDALREREDKVKTLLLAIMQGDSESKTRPKVTFTTGLVQPERHLHRMLFADRDYDDSQAEVELPMDEAKIPTMLVRTCKDTGYSVVYIKSADRPKLLFDALCTLTDMKYNVYHATIDTLDGIAEQEYYVKDMDDCLLETEAERIKVIKCLLAAIERRTPEGLCLKLREVDKPELLQQFTSKLASHDLSITKAEIETLDGRADNVFYVVGADGNLPDMDIIRSMQADIGQSLEIVEPVKPELSQSTIMEKTVVLIRSLSQVFQLFGVAKKG